MEGEDLSYDHISRRSWTKHDQRTRHDMCIQHILSVRQMLERNTSFIMANRQKITHKGISTLCARELQAMPCHNSTSQSSLIISQPNTPARVITPSNSSMLTPPSPPPVASLIMSFKTFSGTSSRSCFATRRKSLIVISRSWFLVNKA
jgi:hypothetical protein